MSQFIQAGFENGVFRPLDPIEIAENAVVRLQVSGSLADVEAWVDHDSLAEANAALGPAPSLEEVRSATARIPGEWSTDVSRDRDERF